MKYFTYLAISIMVVAVLSLFYLKQPNGQSWLSTSVITSETQQLKDKFVSFTHTTYTQAVAGVSRTVAHVIGKLLGDSAGSKTIYKWQDDYGVWHFSDTPNPNGLSVEAQLSPTEVNVMVAEDTAILSGSAKSSTPQHSSASPAVYDPSAIKKLFEDAEKAQQKLQQRSQELNDLIH